MGAAVWNANPQGGGASNYVRTLGVELTDDVSADVGQTIVGLTVAGLEAGQKLVVSFTGSFYYGGGDGAIQLYVDGVAIDTSRRGFSAAAPNQYHELSLVRVVTGLMAGDHTVEIRVSTGTMSFFPVSLPDATGASLVVAVVGA